MTQRPLKCLEIGPHGFRAVVIEPGHPEYEKLLRRDEKASEALERHHFETVVLRSLWETLFWF